MIESVNQDNLADVLPLICAYQQFYNVADISELNNRVFFSQFSENSPLGCQFLYRIDGKAVGFATVYFSFSSTLTKKVAILNDLFTLQSARGKGVGRALIKHAHQYAIAQHAARLQWVTAKDNTQAQSLYDGMKTSKSTWHFYSYNGEVS